MRLKWIPYKDDAKTEYDFYPRFQYKNMNFMLVPCKSYNGNMQFAYIQELDVNGHCCGNIPNIAGEYYIGVGYSRNSIRTAVSKAIKSFKKHIKELQI